MAIVDIKFKAPFQALSYTGTNLDEINDFTLFDCWEDSEGLHYYADAGYIDTVLPGDYFVQVYHDDEEFPTYLHFTAQFFLQYCSLL